MHPQLGAGELRDVLLYCKQVEAAAWLCAKQVHEGGMTFDAGAACLAEQFPELDMDQVDRALGRVTHSLKK